MNITYIIGNGFDLRFGMSTSYADFARHYEPEYCEEENEEMCKILCNSIINQARPRTVENLMRLFLLTSRDGNWSDLELHLGRFTEYLDKDEILQFYPYLNKQLDLFLQQVEQNRPSASDEERDSFSKCLCNPFQFYRNSEQDQIKKHYLGNTKWNVYANIITLNYTSTLEELSHDFYNRDNNLWYSFTLSGIHHVHGKLNDEGILFGVDNTGQISKENMRAEDKILNLIVKPQSNKGIGDLIDEQCMQCISDTNIFCIFGSSLGDTDRTWWHCIGEKFQKDNSTIILLFEYNPKLTGKIRQELIGIRIEIKERLLKALNLDPTNQSLKERVFISLNSGMFPERKRESNLSEVKKELIESFFLASPNRFEPAQKQLGVFSQKKKDIPKRRSYINLRE